MTTSIQTSRKLEQEMESANQYLTFLLAGEEYGVNILKVREIRSREQPTVHRHSLPHAFSGGIPL